MARTRELLWAATMGGASLSLSACGGGGGGGGPAPIPPAPPPPSSAFDTAEYHASNSAVTANALSAYDANATGAGVKVAVIDTGINPNLPEFTGRIDANSQDVAADRGLSDDDGHGTMVSGVIAANRDNIYMHGVAPLATILSLNVGDPAGCKPGQDCFLDEAIDDAIDLARIHGAKIINMSFGDEEGMTADVWPAIQRAVDAGIVIIMSAGNGGTANPNGFALQNIADNGDSGLFIIAGAMTANRTIASFSDRAGSTEAANHYLTALGVGNATVNELGQQVAVNGTSFSAPTIAGAAALLAGAFPHLSGAEIVEILLNSADEAGAAGTDAIFGRGILNIAKAFQPQGATTLAGTAMAVSMSDNGGLAGAMGDARPRAGAIVLDGYSRAFAVNLAGTLRRAPRQQPLRQAMAGGMTDSAEATAGPVSLAVTIRRDPQAGLAFRTDRLLLGEEDGRAARAIAGTAVTRLSPRSAVAFGFAQSGQALLRQMEGRSEGAFLVARDPLAGAGLHADARTSAGFRYGLGKVAVSGFGERGRLAGLQPDGRRNSPYALTGLGADAVVGPAVVRLSASHLREDETVLGARVSPLLSRGGSHSKFLEGSASLALGLGWNATASYRRGWTTMSRPTGASGSDRLHTEAFSLDLARNGLLHADDRLGFRFMQPLRVRSGGVVVNLPTAYDYKAGAASFERQFLSLAPSGRELDFELAYARRLWGGTVDFNAFVRSEPGHVDAAQSDLGLAFRFTARR